MEKSRGILYLCPTPIGNLEDITFRTLKILKEVDLICAEDTRHSLRLLNHFGISKPMISYHEHNKYERINDITTKLNEGLNIALVTDAGTPAISDPGMELVRELRELNMEVVSIPGACACITALSASGRDTSSFVFEGFLPRNKKLRKEVLDRNINEVRTMIFYEAPHHLEQTLKEFLKAFGDRRITIAKEITKIHEKYFYTTIEQYLLDIADVNIKGEYVIIIEGANPFKLKEDKINSFLQLSVQDHLKIYLDKGMTEKEAMKMVAKDRGVSKRDIYSLVKEDR